MRSSCRFTDQRNSFSKRRSMSHTCTESQTLRFAHQGYRTPGLESIPAFCESGADDVYPRARRTTVHSRKIVAHDQNANPSPSISVNIVNGSNWKEVTDFVFGTRGRLRRTPIRIYLNIAGAWRSRRDKRSRIARLLQYDGNRLRPPHLAERRQLPALTNPPRCA